MKNWKDWFKVGIYSKQLTLITALLVLLLVGQIAQWVDQGVDYAFGYPQQEQPLVKGSEEVVVSVEDVEEGGIQYVFPDGRIIMMPKKTRGEEKLVGEVDGDITRIYIDHRDHMEDMSQCIKEDYRIKLQDDFIELWDVKQHKLIGTLTYKTSLGRMIMGDNEHYTR